MFSDTKLYKSSHCEILTPHLMILSVFNFVVKVEFRSYISGVSIGLL